jgi:NADPH2 dehydrogenase
MTTLTDPLKVKGVTLKCRIVMAPMATGLATHRGETTRKLIKHYTVRAQALGLLIVEHSFVTLQGKVSERQLGMHDDEMITGLRRLAQSIHSKGTPTIAQINHGGANAVEKITGMPSVGPTRIEGVHQLSLDEIDELSSAYALAAQRAIKAGFDGVEIHGAHGFLLNQFFSSITNHRIDKYGGCLENRMRFPLEVVERVKEEVGDRILMYRLGTDDSNPLGTTIEDSMKFAKRMEEAGVDLIDVSGGLSGSCPSKLKSTQGYFIPQARQIKKAVNVPVIGVGGIADPEYADRLIQEGDVDLVAIGRALLMDQKWAVKALESRQTG